MYQITAKDARGQTHFAARRSKQTQNGRSAGVWIPGAAALRGRQDLPVDPDPERISPFGVELHPFFQQENALALMKEYGVHPEAWGPFAEGNHGIFTHPVLTAIGQKYGKSAAQVALRWNVQRGVTVIPKSIHKERMEQNLAIWDFQLSDEDMAEIARLDIGHSEIVDHSDPKFVQMLHRMKVHE